MNHNEMIDTLVQSGKYQVMTRIEVETVPFDAVVEGCSLALMIDLETTGLDTQKDKIIELGMVPFEFNADGVITRVFDGLSMFNDPKEPISAEITEITGITDEMVAGQKLDRALILEWVERADLAIAHNASFDRPIIERYFEEFKVIPWACSRTQVDWFAEGIRSPKLEFLIYACGMFHNAHRAEDDCKATIAVLQAMLPKSGVPASVKLIETTRIPMVRLSAKDAPFEMKGDLKANGFHWNGEETKNDPKAWFIDLPETEVNAMLVWLSKDIYGYPVGGLPRRPLTNEDRFSIRE